MNTDTNIVRTRVAIPLDLYRRLQHAAVDKGVTVNELLAVGARLAADEAQGTDPKGGRRNAAVGAPHALQPAKDEGVGHRR